MQTSDFDYDLPQTAIAQTPVEPRDSSRLLVMDRHSGALQDAVFKQLGTFLRPGDLLVRNETRVIPARLYARKASGGKAEILLLRRHDLTTWEALVGGKGLVEGKRLTLADGLDVEIAAVLEGARRLVRFAEPVESHLSRVGQAPLPPYIHTPLQNPERYQTVYARIPGSAAAPTAGLHFTPALIASLEAQGVRFASVTLHVGLDTFAPVTETDPRQHQIHTEWCELPAETADQVNETKASGGRVVAVGTTSVRTLESAFSPAQPLALSPFSGPTSIYILPGYAFKVVDAMITNFHLPKSTLIMLVSAFAGRENILHAYQTAIQKGYRFYSFGDAMFIHSQK
ncbi:MAG: tRNA preQ1(34) S-adenosylmethionine ribosyltransferase-isomerase QueA [Chloroflexota bacterium]